MMCEKPRNFLGACGPQTPTKSHKPIFLLRSFYGNQKQFNLGVTVGYLQAAQSRWDLFRDELAGLKAQFSKLKTVSVLSKNIRNIGAISRSPRIFE